MSTPRFAGVEMVLGGTTYIVPPIALGKIKELQSRIEALDTANGKITLSPEALDTVAELALAALNRNYPEMTKDDVEFLIDMGNVRDVLRIVTGESGLVQRGNAGPGMASP